jgi:hypothetical protein
MSRRWKRTYFLPSGLGPAGIWLLMGGPAYRPNTDLSGTPSGGTLDASLARRNTPYTSSSSPTPSPSSRHMSALLPGLKTPSSDRLFWRREEEVAPGGGFPLHRGMMTLVGRSPPFVLGGIQLSGLPWSLVQARRRPCSALLCTGQPFHPVPVDLGIAPSSR